MVYTWAELESMLASRRAKAQSAAMTPEERIARARHAVAARKWRPKKLQAEKSEDELGHPMGEEITGGE